MMGPRQMAQGALVYDFSIEDHVPADHLLRQIDRFVDLSEIRSFLAPFYSATGRPSVDPELMIRMLIVGYCFGIRSERRLCDEVHLNLAYRWFCRTRSRRRGARPLDLFEEPPRPVPRQRPVPPPLRERARTLHRRGLGRWRRLRRRCLPDQGRRQPLYEGRGEGLVGAGDRDARDPGISRHAYARKKVEMLFARLKRILGLDQLRLRGPNGARAIPARSNRPEPAQARQAGARATHERDGVGSISPLRSRPSQPTSSTVSSA